MAKRTVLIVDDLSGVATPEEELKEIEYAHPVNGKTYLLLTTDENFAKFLIKVTKETDKMEGIRNQAFEAFEETRKAASEVYDAAIAAAAEERKKLTLDLGAPVEAAIAKAAKGYADWEEKRMPARGGRASGSGDPERAREIAIGKARAAFVQSDAAYDIGGSQMRAYIKQRRLKPKGRMNNVLADWLDTPEIRAMWYPAELDSQPSLV
jgi:hypothetical protein